VGLYYRSERKCYISIEALVEANHHVSTFQLAVEASRISVTSRRGVIIGISARYPGIVVPGHMYSFRSLELRRKAAIGNRRVGGVTSVSRSWMVASC
jgi:hypothetical protein